MSDDTKRIYGVHTTRGEDKSNEIGWHGVVGWGVLWGAAYHCVSFFVVFSLILAQNNFLF